MPIGDDLAARRRNAGGRSDVEERSQARWSSRERSAFAFGLHDSDLDDDLAVATSDNLVVVPWRYPCTHTGTFMDIPATDLDFELRGTTFVDIRGPSNAWTYYRYIDFIGALHQIGAAYDVRPVRADNLEVDGEPPP